MLWAGIAREAPPVQAHSVRTLYYGATLIDGTGSPARPDVDILTDSERIVAVGAHGTLATVLSNQMHRGFPIWLDRPNWI